MRRYVTRAVFEDEIWSPSDSTITVYEPDKAPKPTGLYDARGNELYAIDERPPIGFARFQKGKRTCFPS